MAYTLSFQGQRVNASDSNTDWGKVNVGGGAPAAEAANVYQGSAVVGNQIKTAIGGIDYDPASGAEDMTAANRALWFVKCIVTDSADLVATIGAEIRLGSGSGAYFTYVVAGTNANRSRFDAWPAQGGYLIFGLNINVVAWQESETGTVVESAIDYFAFLCDTATGLSKAENMGLDAIDIGTGLELQGTSPVTPGYAAFVVWDQDDTANRYGVVVQPGGAGSPITCVGRLDVGDGSNETDFTSAGEVVIYPDGYHGAGDVGVLLDLNITGSVMSDASTHIGLGVITTEDTRPDYVVVGTTGTLALAAILTNFRNVTLTSAVTADGATIGCLRLRQASADIQNSVVITESPTNVACLQDPTFGATTDLNNTTFEQGGAGHAIEALATGTWTGIKFSGYGGTPGSNLTPASGAADAAIFNDTGGAITITIAGGGDSPSVRNGAGATTTIVAATQVTLTGLQNDTEITVLDAGDQSEIAHVEDVVGNTFAFSDSAANVVDILIHHISFYKADLLGFTIPNDDTAIPVQQVSDPNYVNP